MRLETRAAAFGRTYELHSLTPDLWTVVYRGRMGDRCLSFASEAEARAYLDRYTTPITEVR